MAEFSLKDTLIGGGILFGIGVFIKKLKGKKEYQIDNSSSEPLRSKIPFQFAYPETDTHCWDCAQEKRLENDARCWSCNRSKWVRCDRCMKRGSPVICDQFSGGDAGMFTCKVCFLKDQTIDEWVEAIKGGGQYGDGTHWIWPDEAYDEELKEHHERDNWGGDPDGQLAKTLAKVREESKKRREPLKIERLDAESFEADDDIILRQQAIDTIEARVADYTTHEDVSPYWGGGIVNPNKYLYFKLRYAWETHPEDREGIIQQYIRGIKDGRIDPDNPLPHGEPNQNLPSQWDAETFEAEGNQRCNAVMSHGSMTRRICSANAEYLGYCPVHSTCERCGTSLIQEEEWLRDEEPDLSDGHSEGFCLGCWRDTGKYGAETLGAEERKEVNKYKMGDMKVREYDDGTLERYEAQRIQYDYMVHREPSGTEVDDDGNRIPNPRGGRFTSADAESDSTYTDRRELFNSLKVGDKIEIDAQRQSGSHPHPQRKEGIRERTVIDVIDGIGNGHWKFVKELKDPLRRHMGNAPEKTILLDEGETILVYGRNPLHHPSQDFAFYFKKDGPRFGGQHHWLNEPQYRKGKIVNVKSLNAESFESEPLCSCEVPRPRHAGIHPTVCQSCNLIIEAEGFDAETRKLKKDSCCCGATKKNPCECMYQGISPCSSTCPCALENKKKEQAKGHMDFGAESFNAEGGCKECYGTGGLYDSHMGINDECRSCEGTGFDAESFESETVAFESFAGRWNIGQTKEIEGVQLTKVSNARGSGNRRVGAGFTMEYQGHVGEIVANDEAGYMGQKPSFFVMEDGTLGGRGTRRGRFNGISAKDQMECLIRWKHKVGGGTLVIRRPFKKARAIRTSRGFRPYSGVYKPITGFVSKAYTFRRKSDGRTVMGKMPRQNEVWLGIRYDAETLGAESLDEWDARMKEKYYCYDCDSWDGCECPEDFIAESNCPNCSGTLKAISERFDECVSCGWSDEDWADEGIDPKIVGYCYDCNTVKPNYGNCKCVDDSMTTETLGAETKMHPNWCSNCGMKDDGCINLGYGDWYCMNFLNNRETYDGRYDAETLGAEEFGAENESYVCLENGKTYRLKKRMASHRPMGWMNESPPLPAGKGCFNCGSRKCIGLEELPYKTFFWPKTKHTGLYGAESFEASSCNCERFDRSAWDSNRCATCGEMKKGHYGAETFEAEGNWTPCYHCQTKIGEGEIIYGYKGSRVEAFCDSECIYDAQYVEAESFSAETFLANEMPFKSFWLVAKKGSKSFPAGQLGELRLYENGERTIILDNNLIIPFYNQALAYAYLNEHFMVYPKKGNVDKGLLMGAEGDDHDHDHDHDHEDIDELIEKINRVTDFAITFIHDGGFGGEPKGFIVDEDLGLKTEIVNYVEGSIDLRLVRDLETNELMSVRFALTGDPDDTPILYLPLPEQLTTTPDEERAIKRS